MIPTFKKNRKKKWGPLLHRWLVPPWLCTSRSEINIFLSHLSLRRAPKSPRLSKQPAVPLHPLRMLPTTKEATWSNNHFEYWIRLDSIGLDAKSWCLLQTAGRRHKLDICTKRLLQSPPGWEQQRSSLALLSDQGPSWIKYNRHFCLFRNCFDKSDATAYGRKFDLSAWWVLPIVYVLPLRMHPYTLEFWQVFVRHSSVFLGAWQDGKSASQPDETNIKFQAAGE